MSISRDKAKEDSITMLNALYQQIADTAESVVPLYDAIEDFFFQDVDYQKIKSIIPLWMMDAGRSPESGFDKGLYEQLRSVKCQRDRSVTSAYQTALKKKDDIAIALALSPFARKTAERCQRDRSVASASA